MQNEPIRVFIADDHPIVRSGLLLVLAADPRCTLAGTADSFTVLLTQLATTPADVLVLDLGGMGGPALPLVAHLRREYPALRLLVFSSTIDLAPELFQAGVQGYVVKEEIIDYLITSIIAVMAGQVYTSPSVTAYMERIDSVRRRQRLAPQEVHVLKLLCQGLSTIEIGNELQIDGRSVQNYITDLFRKTGCKERTQLVAWYRLALGDARPAT